MADTLPSIALAFEKDNVNSMREKPNGIERRVFTPFMVSTIIGSAIIEVATSLAVFFVARGLFGIAVAQTLALLSVVFNEFVFTYNCKELKGSSIKKGLFNNRVLNLITLSLMGVQLLVFFTPVGILFGLAEITAIQFLAVFGINIVAFFAIELIKPVLARLFSDK